MYKLPEKMYTLFGENVNLQNVVKTEGGGTMDYRKTAQQICDNIGGRKNIISAEHCATRLRLVIGDNDKCSNVT